MKKELIQSIKIIALSLFIGLGVSFAYATWEEPLSMNDSISGPINVGITDQVKNGGLAVNAFKAYMNSEFIKGITIASLSDTNTSKDDRPICVDKDGTVKICGIDPLEAYFYTPQFSCLPWPHENCKVEAVATGGVPAYSYSWTINGVHSNSSLYHNYFFNFGTMQSAEVSVVISDSAGSTKTISGSFDFTASTGYGSNND